MILTDLEHADEQIPMNARLRQAVEFLRASNLAELPVSRIELDGQRLYVLVRIYENLVEGEPKFEVHHNYLDLHYVAEGEEIMGWAPLDRFVAKTPYDPVKDVINGTVSPEQLTRIRMPTSFLALMYPTDAHAPKMAPGSDKPLKKVVVKIAV